MYTSREPKFTVVSGVRVRVRVFLSYQIDNRLVGCKRLHTQKGCDSNRPGVRKGAPTSM